MKLIRIHKSVSVRSVDSKLPKRLRKLQEDGVIGQPYCDLRVCLMNNPDTNTCLSGSKRREGERGEKKGG